MENTAIIIETDISLSPLLLKFLAMFQMGLLYHEHNEGKYVVEAIDIHRINFNINTGLHLKDK